jgi:hypothetical protein
MPLAILKTKPKMGPKKTERSQITAKQSQELAKRSQEWGQRSQVLGFKKGNLATRI